jgi:hypothetical protein
MTIRARFKRGTILLLLFLSWAWLIGATWSRVPFWPDADGYTSHVAEGRWVAHPPGYLLFVLAGHAFHLLGLPAYPAVQAASLLFTLGALPLLYRLFRRVCRPETALLLVAAFTFSWNVLLLSRTGTSHAGDFFSVSLLLLLATSPGLRAGQTGTCLAYGSAVVLCAGLRLTTAIMMVPLFLAVLLRNWKKANVWIAYVLAGLTVLALQLTVIRLSGGWEAYGSYSQAMHQVNRPSSIVLSGVNGATLLNIGRAFGWWGLSLSFLLLLPAAAIFRSRISTAASRSGWLAALHSDPQKTDVLLYGALSALGCLGMAASYLCTHPGYISAALPGTFACIAVFASLASPRLTWAIFGVYFVTTLAFFLLVRPFPRPAGAFQAAANGLLLQYTGHAVKNSLFKTTSVWLRDSGLEELVPENRKADLDREARQKEATSRP